MHTEQEHIRSWLTGREHWILGKEVSESFDKTLSEFPWTTSHVRWSQVPHTVLRLPDDDNWTPFLGEASRTPAARHAYVYIMYSWREPGILCRTTEALPDIDYLYSSAPGPRYFCGADVSDGTPLPSFRDFAEYDGGDEITAYTP